MNKTSVNFSNSKYFDNEHLRRDLKNRSIRGGAAILTAQIIKFAFQATSTIFFARLLLPEDYGIFGMATVIASFVDLFKDLGLSAATVQRANIDHQQVSTLFWINLGLGICTSVIVAILAPIIALFYGEPRLTPVVLSLSISFIFGGLAVQHQALLLRNMAFKSLAIRDILSLGLSLSSGVISALLGAGYWALVIMQLVNTSSNALLLWLACDWRPGWPSRKSGVGSMVAFGSNVTGFRVTNYFSRSFDNIIIGKAWGATELGLYAKAYQLLVLPYQQINAPITSVALPTLSKLQDDIDAYQRYYYKALLLIGSLGLPLVAFFSVSASKAIEVFLGENWMCVVPIFLLLMPAALVAALNVSMSWAYMSLGRADRQFRWGVFTSIFDIIIMLIGVKWGALGVAAALGITRPLIFILSLYYCFYRTPLKVSRYFVVLIPPLTASLLSVLVVSGVNQLYQPAPFPGLLVNTVIFGTVYILGWIIPPSSRKTLSELLHLVKEIKRSKKQKMIN